MPWSPPLRQRPLSPAVRPARCGQLPPPAEVARRCTPAANGTNSASPAFVTPPGHDHHGVGVHDVQEGWRCPRPGSAPYRARSPGPPRLLVCAARVSYTVSAVICSRASAHQRRAGVVAATPSLRARAPRTRVHRDRRARRICLESIRSCHSLQWRPFRSMVVCPISPATSEAPWNRTCRTGQMNEAAADARPNRHADEPGIAACRAPRACHHSPTVAQFASVVQGGGHARGGW